MYVRARSGRENVNGYLRYSLCLKFMQNTYFGILDIARNPREGREMRALWFARQFTNCISRLCPAGIAIRGISRAYVQNTTYAISSACVFYSSARDGVPC